MRNQNRAMELEMLGIRILLPSVKTEPNETAFYIHSHPFYELHICLQGKCRYQCSGRIIEVSAGQFCLFAPGVYHTPLRDQGEYTKQCVMFEEMSDTQLACARLKNSMCAEPLRIGNAQSLIPILQQIQEERNAAQAFSEEMTAALYTQLILHLVRALDALYTEQKTRDVDLDTQRSMIIDDFFSRCFPESAGDQKLANMLGVSSRQLNRIMRRMYGQGFRDKLTEVRMETACDLLRSSKMSIRKIAERVGYTSPSNFTSCFRRVKQISPMEYRAQHRE